MGNPDRRGPDPGAGIAALVLAGRRGSGDALLAAAQGVGHRALVRVAGVPSLLRVVETLRRAETPRSIAVSVDDPSVLDSVGKLRELRASGELEAHASCASPSTSVLDYLERRSGGAPVFVTTADHPLLTPAMVDHFCREALARDADLVVGVVDAELVHARYPESVRTVIRLGRDRICGANLFVFRTPLGKRAAAFWVRAERFRKRPWKLVRVFGLRALLRFALGRLDLASALELAAGAIGARIDAVRMPFAECAIDVDRPDDLTLASRILASRAGAAR